MFSLLVAFLAGVFTIGSPCILPLLPILLGSCVGQKNRKRPLFILLGFILSFALVSTLLTTLVGFLEVSPERIQKIATILLALFGFFMVWPKPFEWLIFKFSFLFSKVNTLTAPGDQGGLSGFFLGLVLGVVWTPCAGPVLGTILTLIAIQAHALQSFALLIAYALGASIPMLLIAYGGQFITMKVKKIAPYAFILQRVFGLLILILAIAMYFEMGIFTSSGNKLSQKLEEVESRLFSRSSLGAEEKAFSREVVIPLGAEGLIYLSEEETPSFEEKEYTLPMSLNPNRFALSGTWQFYGDRIVLKKSKGQIAFKTSLKKISIIAMLPRGGVIKVSIDEAPFDAIAIHEKKEYLLFSSAENKERTIVIEISDPGFEIYSFNIEE